MTEADAAPEKWERSYDLYLLPADKRFFFRNKDCGITLTDWDLRWSADGKPDHAPLTNIAQVRLQSGGDWKNPLNQCVITFRDGYTLTVTDGDARGVADAQQTPIYGSFVRALHARLALAPPGTIAFVRGLPKTNFHIAAGGTILLGLMLVATPLVLLIITGRIEALFAMLGGVALCWPMYRMVRTNTPQPYNPKEPPQELME